MTRADKEARRILARVRRNSAGKPGPAAMARTRRSFRRWKRFLESQPAAPKRPGVSPVKVPRFAHADWLEQRIRRDRRRNGVEA